MTSESYAGVLKGRLAQGPWEPSKNETQTMAERLKMQDRVELELVVAASHLGRYAKFHPTQESPGEELLDNLYRSSAGFLINRQGVEVKLHKDKVRKEMEFFQKHVVIAYFVGGSPPYVSLQEWIGGLTTEINEECRLGREIGNGFFQIIKKLSGVCQNVVPSSRTKSRVVTPSANRRPPSSVPSLPSAVQSSPCAIRSLSSAVHRLSTPEGPVVRQRTSAVRRFWECIGFGSA